MYQFTEDCRTGIEQIDEEHRTLFELLNEAYSLVTCTGEIILTSSRT